MQQLLHISYRLAYFGLTDLATLLFGKSELEEINFIFMVGLMVIFSPFIPCFDYKSSGI